MEKMNISNLKIGDLIVRQKGPFSTHYIVWIGYQNGVPIVAENQIGHGVRYTTLREALNGKPILRFEKFGGTETQRSLVIPKINKMLGKQYDLIVFNCEHFARWISTGKSESRQVNFVSWIAIIVGTYLITRRSKPMQTLGAFLLFFGFVLKMV